MDGRKAAYGRTGMEALIHQVNRDPDFLACCSTTIKSAFSGFQNKGSQNKE